MYLMPEGNRYGRNV